MPCEAKRSLLDAFTNELDANLFVHSLGVTKMTDGIQGALGF